MSYYLGATIVYLLVQVVVLWFSHCVMTFWNIKFPFHASTHKHTNTIKYIHATVLVMGLVIPGVPVAAAFATGGFVLTSFPPITCTVRDRDALFYSIILPVCIVVASGVSLLVLVLDEIFKVSVEVALIRLSRFLNLDVQLVFVCIAMNMSSTTYRSRTEHELLRQRSSLSSATLSS